LAYSQPPTFNPQTPKDFAKKSTNDLYQNTYQPPSTFKTYRLPPPIQQPKFKPHQNYKSPHTNIITSQISHSNKTPSPPIP
ncbi:penicillin-binding transpeptidase domain-containing protein, partial [Staphylococcus epidermidis]|uniref:penicillin-binding transpeptidase domain-containing protein n=1 Tax=Staphylococcus epidermidis TaxID=1282 RepID=UPI0021B1BDCF